MVCQHALTVHFSVLEQLLCALSQGQAYMIEYDAVPVVEEACNITLLGGINVHPETCFA